MIRFLQTPGPIKKIVLGGMLLIICAAMVITLVPGGLGSNFGFGGLPDGTVASVEGQEVTTQELNRTLDQMIKAQFPQGGEQANMLRPFFSSRALEQLISQKALLSEAHRLGLRATDDEVRDELQHGRYSIYFFPEGKFIGQQQYETFLNQNGLTVPRFEAAVKDDIVMSKLRNLIAGSATITDLEIRREFEQKNTKVKFEYAVLSREDMLKGIHPSETELKAFYDQNKARYTNSIPEKRKARYALIENGKLEGQTQISHDELQAYYNQHRDEYRVPDQVNVRHILIKTPPAGADSKVDSKGLEEARKKAEDVLKQLKSGAKFEDLAKKYSDDPGSAKNGGSLSWVNRGQTVPEFEKAAFSLPKGGTSDLVQSSYGFHIIHVDDKQDAHLKSLDEVKSQIEPVLKQQKVAQAVDTQARTLLNAAKTNGLEKAAAAQGLQVVTTDFFASSDSLPGIGNSPQFTQAVFSAADKAPPDVVQLNQGSAVFEVIGIKPPETPALEQIHSGVETDFKNERVATLLSQKTQELSDRAKAEHDLKKAAKEAGATIKTSDLVAQDGQVPDVGSMAGPASVAFTLKPGEISGPINAGASGVVLTVIDRQQPSHDDFTAKKDEIRDTLRVNKQNEVFAVFLSNLRDQMQKSGKIKINQNEMKKLGGSPSGEEGG
jgi:peptidyl-prolyl cis-trans isomerase D